MSNCSCSTENCCAPQTKKIIHIDFLYLDTTVCGRCQDTETSLDEALSSTALVLSAAGYDVQVNKVNIETEELATKHQFVSSPTIRVNGRDIAMELKESHCENCGTLCGDDVDCRVWVHEGIEYTSPPKELIINGILREIYNGGKQVEAEEKSFELPENLKKYFGAKAKKDAGMI